MKYRLQKGLHQTTLHDGSWHSQKVLQKRHWKNKQICEGIRLFSSYFSGPGKVKHSRSAPAMNAQQALKAMFKELINEDYSTGTDIERYKGVLEYALWKVDFSVGIGIYMLPSNLNLNIGRTKGYNNKILVSSTGMKIGSNRDINWDHKKLTAPDVPKKTVFLAAQHDAPHNLTMLTEKHKDEKPAITLLIVGTGLIAYHFW